MSRRIAISGTAGIGKSTLATRVAKALNIPFIDEGFDTHLTRSVLQQQGDVLVSAFESIRVEKLQREEHAGERFVSDRGALDLIYSWLHFQLERHPKSTSFLDHCQAQLNRYDFIVLPPWGSFSAPALGPERHGQARNQNPMSLLRAHASIVGLAHMWVPKPKIIEIPQAVTDIDSRVELVVNTIQRRESKNA